MQASDVVVFIICSVLTLALWGRWYLESIRVRPFGRRGVGRWILQTAPILCMVILHGVIRNFAARDVRNSSHYIALYLLLGAAWLAIVERCAVNLGLSARDDVFERENLAAAVALSGLLLGATLSFAGANVGEGPGWYAVAFCAALSTGGLFLVWWVLNLIVGVSEAVSVERDLATGFRAAGFFIASGLLLGRAVAGDWESWGATVVDFLKYAWLVLIPLCGAIILEHVFLPNPVHFKPPAWRWGVLPAFVYLGLAVTLVFVSGGWR